ncbi:ABC transporter permease [Bifidobacterium sp. 79T10]|nr:ABC transporter permease [Bifidobacterium saguinibicoloris]MBW3081351.1 ABC transporter permease [Bifidobacterium saguinibicoloris]
MAKETQQAKKQQTKRNPLAAWWHGVDRPSKVLYGTVLVVCLVFYILLGNTLYNIGTLQSMGFQIGEFMFLALAMGIVMLTGGIDLSVVANMNVSAIIIAWMLSGSETGRAGSPGTSIALAVALGILATVLCGVVNGCLVSLAGVNPIVATLGTQLLFTGVASAATNGSSIGVYVDGYSTLGIATVAGIPVVFLLGLVCYAIVGWVTSRTRYGRELYFYGSNPVASLFSGHRVNRTLILTYAAAGVFVGLAAMVMVARVNSARVGFGETYLLQALLVVVLAGFDPFGGRGRFGNLLLAVVMLQVLQTGFTILNFSPFVKNLAWGAALIIVMVLSRGLELWSAARKVGRPTATKPVTAKPTATAQ